MSSYLAIRADHCAEEDDEDNYLKYFVISQVAKKLFDRTGIDKVHCRVTGD